MRDRRRTSLFRPAAMVRVELLVLLRDQRAVLTTLGTAQQAELIPSSDEAFPRAPGEPGPQLDRCKSIAERAARLREALCVPVAPTPAAAPSRGPSLEEMESQLAHWETRLEKFREQEAELGARRDALRGATDRAAPLLELGVPTETLTSSEYVHFAIGSMQEGSPSTVSEDPVVIVPVESREGKRRVIAAAGRHRTEAVEARLRRIGFAEEAFPDLGSVPLEVWLHRNQEELAAVESELGAVRSQREELAVGAAGPLAAIEESARVEEALFEAESGLGGTGSTARILAWVPRDGLADFEARVRDVTGGVHLMNVEEADPRGDAPVLVRHGSILGPFSLLVSGYGTPRYGEIEPTPLFAVSYVVMFGIMFGDVGHGLLLAAGGLALRRFGRSRLLRDVGTLAGLLGAASMVFGAVYGSFFGIEELKRFALWRDPIEGNPMAIMVACVGFGMALISAGIVLNIVNLLRAGDRIGAWTDKFGLSGLVFYWGALALLLLYDSIAARGILPWAIAALALPVVAWTLREPLEWLHHRKGRARGAPGIGTAIGSSAAEAFEALLVFLASTISFVRLAAYAMSHAALLMAIFMIASELRSIPGGSIVVLVLGNAVIIVLEATIAAVQALRLEYYEFFGKFFHGTGRPFAPFQISCTSAPSRPSRRH